ncbi:hypothetical protein ACE7GA_20875 [Roseomonas sp. CCTCC AB2023176]|uniref:hypothetical protein n=1 Tax=Roseomonas sp. CCTCC AB2023176 TaxID=3342640 RepID=UPI0035DF295E
MSDSPLPIRVVILTMFDPGDAESRLANGELRRWVERFPPAKRYPSPSAQAVCT